MVSSYYSKTRTNKFIFSTVNQKKNEFVCLFFGRIVGLKEIFKCSIDAAQQRMALNFELVVSDQLFAVVLATYK